jgi:hypothetical protein
MIQRSWWQLCGMLVVALGLTSWMPRASTQQASWVVHTAEVATGAFCLSGLPEGSVRASAELDLGGVKWSPTQVTIDRAETGARFTVYDAPYDWANAGPVDCSKTPPGRTVVISGNINSGSRLQLQRSHDGLWVMMSAGGVHLELGRVTVASSSLLGGTVSFKNRLLWIDNDDKVDIREGKSVSGRLLLAATDVGIAGVQLALGTGSTPQPLDVSVSGQRATFGLNLANARLTLWNGSLWADQPPLKPAPMALAGLAASSAQLSARRFELKATAGHLQGTFNQLSLAATQFEHGPAPATRFTPKGAVTAESLSGSIADAVDIAALRQAQFTKLVADTDNLVVFDSTGTPALQGGGRLALDRVADDTMAGGLELRRATIPSLGALLGQPSIDTFVMRFDGDKSAPKLTGTGLLAALGLRNLRFDAPAPGAGAGHLGFSSAWDSGTLSIPFNVDTSAGPATVVILDPALGDPQVTGSVEQLHLEGRVTFASAGPSIDIPPQGAALSLKASVAAKPVLFGSKPVLAQAGLSVRNPVPLRFVRGGSQGSLMITGRTLVVPDGDVFFDTGGVQLNVPLTTAASTSISYDVASGNYAFSSGSLQASGINATALGAAPLRFGDISVAGASLHLDAITLAASSGAVTATATGFEASARSVEHDAQPKFSGSLSKPLKLASFTAQGDQSVGKLQLRHVVATGLSLSATNLTYSSVDGLQAIGDASIEAKQFSDDAVQGFTLDLSGRLAVAGATSGSATLKTFHVEADGSKVALSGRVNASIRDLSLESRQAVPMPHGCSPMNMRLQASIGDIDLQGTLQAGRVQGSVQVPSVGVGVREDGRYGCTFDQPVHIDVVWVVYPCGSLLSPRLCHPEIDVNVRWLVDVHYFEVDASAQGSALRFSGQDGVSMCGGTLTGLKGPFIAGAYVPQFNSGISGVDQIVNGSIAVVGGSFESLLLSQFGALADLTNVFYRPQLLGGNC